MADNLYISSSKIMEEKHFLKFSKRIIVFLIIIVLLDQISGFILRKGFFNMKAGETYRTTYTLDSVKTDIIVLGASRANHHYVPKIFERNLNMSFYNAGRDGSGLLNNYVMFKAIIERYSPKLIVFDLMPSELIYSENAYERLTTLLPYYSNHAEIRDVLELRSPFEKYKLCSAIYPFNSLLLRILFRNLESLKETDNSKKGYSHIPNTHCSVLVANIKLASVTSKRYFSRLLTVN